MVPRNESAQGTRPPLQRREVRFLVVFLLVLVGSFTFLSLQQVNDYAIEPLTGWIATASGAGLNLLGQEVTQEGTALRSPRFAVNIRNGCNGVEAMVIFLAAVVAFPAPWASRAIGLLLGVLGIQVVNLIRVVALFLTGAYFPSWFDSSHTVIWQGLVILSAVLLWIFWARRFALPSPGPAE
jgi:exosortase H (IPTLxxWG-CTERM-specific)